MEFLDPAIQKNGFFLFPFLLSPLSLSWCKIQFISNPILFPFLSQMAVWFLHGHVYGDLSIVVLLAHSHTDDRLWTQSQSTFKILSKALGKGRCGCWVPPHICLCCLPACFWFWLALEVYVDFFVKTLADIHIAVIRCGSQAPSLCEFSVWKLLWSVLMMRYGSCSWMGDWDKRV